MLGNLGQLYRYDLAEAYRHLPNADGTYHNRRLDRFLAGADPHTRTWLITVAGGLGGFVMAGRVDQVASINDCFVVRPLRRTGVGRVAAGQVIAGWPGRWRIVFQSYNPGAQSFWLRVATDAVGPRWYQSEVASVPGAPPDVCLSFDTSLTTE
ncbi:GNAT family N-acetyltransferase [Solwaraspora sp. WMMB335]|uniref:GNAT family N-acetyltransferase n=1 Tax=Solwaraspora sp. WMMB335 TaxID=3404118 RepID=UPI003B949633